MESDWCFQDSNLIHPRMTTIIGLLLFTYPCAYTAAVPARVWWTHGRASRGRLPGAHAGNLFAQDRKSVV